MFREHLRYIGKGKSEQSPGNFHEDRLEPLSTLVVNRNLPRRGVSLRGLEHHADAYPACMEICGSLSLGMLLEV